MAYEKLCDEGILKDEFKIIERKGLSCSLYFSSNFKIECIKVVLSRIHDMKLWLQNGHIEISKKVIHNVTKYPTMNKKKMMHFLRKEEIEANTSAEWNG